MTREPGDLPSVVVTREHVGRGVLTVAEPARCVGPAGETSFAVTCHNVAPEVSYHASIAAAHIVPQAPPLFILLASAIARLIWGAALFLAPRYRSRPRPATSVCRKLSYHALSRRAPGA